jgi:predicted nucleic acid-binding protein
MKIVLDASAAVEVVLGRERSVEFIDGLECADLVLVPSLYVSEVTNVFWKYNAHGGLNQDDCCAFLEKVLELPDEFFDDVVMAQEAFSTAVKTGLTAYDAYYLVLARRHNAMLMSLDKKLTRVARENGVRVSKYA